MSVAVGNSLWSWGDSGTLESPLLSSSVVDPPAPMNFTTLPFTTTNVGFVEVTVSDWTSAVLITRTDDGGDYTYLYAWGNPGFFGQGTSVELPLLVYTTTRTVNGLSCGYYHCLFVERDSRDDYLGRGMAVGDNRNHGYPIILEGGAMHYPSPIVAYENVTHVNAGGYLSRFATATDSLGWDSSQNIFSIGKNDWYLLCQGSLDEDGSLGAFSVDEGSTGPLSFIGGASKRPDPVGAVFLIRNEGKNVSGCGKESDHIPGVDVGVPKFVDATVSFFNFTGSYDTVISISCCFMSCFAILANSSGPESQWIASWGSLDPGTLARAYGQAGPYFPSFVDRGEVPLSDFVVAITSAYNAQIFLGSSGRLYAFGGSPSPLGPESSPVRILTNANSSVVFSSLPPPSDHHSYVFIATTTSCSGFFQGHPLVCSGNGDCVLDETCDCDLFHQGENCDETAICFGLDTEDPEVCSSRGWCTTDPVSPCHCRTGYTGPECEFIVCHGVSTEQSPCASGNGICESPDNCVCHPDYYGYNCLERITHCRFTDVSYLRLEVGWVAPKSFALSLGDDFDCGTVIANLTDALETQCWFALDPSNDVVTSRLVISFGTDDSTLVRDVIDVGDHVSVIPFTALGSVVILPVGDVELVATWPYVVVAVCSSVCVMGGIAALVILVFCCVVARSRLQKRQLDRFSQLDGFDVLLKEQLALKAGGQQELLQFKIDRSLFAIGYDSLKIQRKLGQGGSQAVVFLAEYENHEVAFKCFSTTDLCETQGRIEEFEKEVTILGSVRHPNILGFYGATLHPPRVGIVMEYCEFGDLKVFLTERTRLGEPYRLNQRLRMLTEISSALRYLHAHNIVHRDMKCENVLVTSEEQTKVIDFGLSKMVARQSLAKTQRIGTSHYMAPEVTLGDLGVYGPPCDLFSFAIIIWEVMRNDFEPYGSLTQSAFSIELKVAADANFRPPIYNDVLCGDPSVDSWLIPLMKSCWSHSPEERPTSEEVFLGLDQRKLQDPSSRKDEKAELQRKKQIKALAEQEIADCERRIAKMRERIAALGIDDENEFV